MRQCLFCDQTAKTKEHLWPDWVLRSLHVSGPIRHSIGKSAPVLLAAPELQSRCVCRDCNNGWMSQVEDQSRPLVGSLMHDISLWLDLSRQFAVAVWSVKTAMVVESVRGATHRPYYSSPEREQLRSASSVPTRTNIWLGRFSGNSIGAFGTDLRLDFEGIQGAAHGLATTLIVGHLAIQVLSVRTVPAYNMRPIEVRPKNGAWDRLLTSIWPAAGTVRWPPELTFTNGGALPIASLMDRWRIGSLG
jgi:hypothetical protein